MRMTCMCIGVNSDYIASSPERGVLVQTHFVYKLWKKKPPAI